MPASVHRKKGMCIKWVKTKIKVKNKIENMEIKKSKNYLQ